MSFSLIQSAKASTGSTNGTSASVATSATGSGNLLVALVSITGTAGVTITPPAGWTLVGTTQGVVSGSGTIALYYKENSASGLTSHVFSFSAAVNAAVAFEEWHGVVTASSLDQFVAQQNAKSTAAPTGTTAALAGAGELAIWGLGVGAASILTYSSITNSYVEDVGSNAASSQATRAEATLFNNSSVGPGATSSATTMSGTGSTGNTTILAVFKSAAAGTPTLATSPSSLSFSATFGGANPASQSSTLSETGGTATAWTSAISYGSGSGWLALAPTSGSLSGMGTQALTISPTTGALPVGVYTATITLTATTGGATATISVTFNVNPTPTPAQAPSTITLAGQNITQYVDQLTLEIDDTLGQGSGAGSSGSTQGRAATIKFNTNLGPMSRAIGAGQPIPSSLPSTTYVMRAFGSTLINSTLIAPTPVLVRQGEIIVTDASGTIVFGGFATKYTDSSTSVLGNNMNAFTTLEGIDYSTSLQRTQVNEVFSAATDIQIISFIMKKYAPWVSLQYLPTRPAYLFPVKNFRNVSVEQVLQTVAGVTGYLVFVDYQKALRYIPPTSASSTPFNLSTSPDFVTTFPHTVTEFVVDDNSAINRVLFFGGTKLSNNYWQDISPMVNGNNKVFTLAYFPTQMSDGKFHVQLGGSNGIGGTEQKVGTANSTGAANTFISAGGTAQVIIDPGSRSLAFDVAPSGTTLFVGYRYSFPLSILLTDEKSHQFFGDPYLDGFINDSTIFDLTTGLQRSKVLLAQQSFGLVSLKVDTYKAGIQSGMLINVSNSLRGINGTYLVQQVQISPYGGGNFVYHVSLGAWNWNLIDFLLKLPTLAAFMDTQPDELTDTVVIEQVFTNVRVHDAWSKKTSVGPYYARSTPVGDGHDAYPGFATLAS